MKYIIALLLAFATLMSTAYAQTKHSPLTIIVPYPPGGDTDVLARLFATKYTEKTGRVTVIENRPGAAGVIGFLHISKATNDGTVIGLVPSTLVTAPYFNPNAAKYDPKTDFTPIMQLTGHGMFIAVNANTGVKTVPELITAIKAGKIKAYGTPGVASPQNIFGEMFKKETNTNIIHIPYKGNAEIINSLLAGDIQMTFNTALSLLPHVESGKVNIIATASHRRSIMHPEVPTLEEYGIKGVDFESWLGFVGPKDMDKSATVELNAAFNDIMKQPDVQERLKKLAMVPIGASSENFRDKISKHADKFQRVSKELDIKIE